MRKRKLERFEICELLKEQILRLNQQAIIYDSGDYSIAKDMAVKLRVIYHNTNNSKSLIRQLQFHKKDYLDTGERFDPKNLITFHGLLKISISNNNSELMPKLENSEGRYVNFENWWNSKKVIVDKHKKAFTRRKIILEVANTDGGAHVDPDINIDYDELSRKNSINWEVGKEGDLHAINNPIFPTIRQIVYETIETFKHIIIE
jgi:hypothetical protein